MAEDEHDIRTRVADFVPTITEAQAYRDICRLAGAIVSRAVCVIDRSHSLLCSNNIHLDSIFNISDLECHIKR